MHVRTRAALAAALVVGVGTAAIGVTVGAAGPSVSFTNVPSLLRRRRTQLSAARSDET